MIKEDNEQLHAWIPSNVMHEFRKIIEIKYNGRYGGLSTELTLAIQEHVFKYKKENKQKPEVKHTHTKIEDKTNEKERRIHSKFDNIRARLINYTIDKITDEPFSKLTKEQMDNAIIFATNCSARSLDYKRKELLTYGVISSKFNEYRIVGNFDTNDKIESEILCAVTKSEEKTKQEFEKAITGYPLVGDLR